MALRINLNTAALTAHRLLADTDSTLSKSIERLSSGFKINSAADDPAGLVISEKLRAQVGGLGQAVKNAGDAVNMVKTAEAALNEVSRLLRSMRDLAVHAANTGANDKATALADQAQITNAIGSINKIAQETQFGQKKLLDGTAGIKADIVGNDVVVADLSKVNMTTNTADVYIDLTQTASHGQLLANKVYATGGTVLGATGYLTINNVRIDYTSTDTAGGLVSAINGVSDQTGVIASYTAGGSIQLVSRGYGSVGGRIQVTDANSVLLNGITSTATGGLNAEADVTTDAAFANAITDASWVSGDGLTLRDSLGNSIELTQAAGTVAVAATRQLSITGGTLVFQVGAYAGQIRTLNLNSVMCENLGTGAVTGQSLSSVDVTTPTGAQNAIGILDKAIQDISSTRAELGAIQKNVFESSISSLSIAKENIQASESTIRDTDMAAEVVQLTRNQILQQAGTSMLAQANQTPQTLLKLLQ